jgi:hypothetical protein
VLFIFFARGIFVFAQNSPNDPVRVNIVKTIPVSLEKPAPEAANIVFGESVLVELEGDIRYVRGIELDITANAAWLPNYGALAVGIYANVENAYPESQNPNSPKAVTRTGIQDIKGKRLVFEPLPAKIQTVYQIPLRARHGFRNTPYTQAILELTEQSSFPVLLRLTPITKGFPDELETMRFSVGAKAVLSNDGAVKIMLSYPPGLENLPTVVLIDDKVIDNPEQEQVLAEGEHHLTLLSSDYRNEMRRFVVPRNKTIELSLTLSDLTPLLILEAPLEAAVYLDGTRIEDTRTPLPVEPGSHEVRIQVSDYALVKRFEIEKGKTYRITFSAELNIAEEL